MPRRRMMDRMMQDSRNPYGSRGGYVTDGRRGRRMGGRDMTMREDYDMAGQNRDYGFHEERGYRPVEAMGYFSGYYGTGEDMARGGRGRDSAMDRRDYDMNYDYRGRRDYGMDRNDYNYDMNYDYRGRRDYAFGMRGYDYAGDYAGDYGETLTKEELEKLNKKLSKDVDEKEKHFFTKENIGPKARQMGVQMEGFNEDELAAAALLSYSTYCMALKPYLGSNMDAYIFMGKAFLNDKNASVKGGEKLAVYYDSIIEGEDD